MTSTKITILPAKLESAKYSNILIAARASIPKFPIFILSQRLPLLKTIMFSDSKINQINPQI
jgi:hypothetical protein